jgi:hypothetical protein
LFWQGTFKAAVKVQWVIPFCDVPFSKVNHLIAPVFARAKLNQETSSEFDQVEFFSSRQKHMYEVPHEIG